ncbi:hypothetical protein C2E20_7279 [Micractinium conductrix]|uniref:Peptidase M11 gametolysin domain-containing protein n=1 Tax=Micractinium conductrix TaxID=554055 RepID=A0A2P6V573_9CHLO|nr:hypothetical protein C2E20_7279 [Micractinium conductrix]|eukprot:PSC69234.1 hypothetical protein C2E20_7279 [Micractinium conductrix]
MLAPPGRVVVLEQDHGNHLPSTQLLLLHTTSHGRVRLHGGAAPRGLRTGQQLNVTGVWRRHTHRSLRRSLRASLGGAATAGATAVQGSTEPYPHYLLPLRVSMQPGKAPTPELKVVAKQPHGAACPGTQLPTASVSDIERAVFAEVNPSGITVGSTFSGCSYGKSRLTQRNSQVAAPVELPCAGSSQGYPWTTSKCAFEDFNGWADAANAVLQARGVNLAAYKYKVYLVPPGPCSFVGLGYVGCDGSFECRAWVGSEHWTTPQAISHELGHNIFLAHSGAVTPEGGVDEYGDDTGIMGYCCADRCPNTAQAWQLGWSSVQHLDAASLAPGKPCACTAGTVGHSSKAVHAWLASQGASAANGVRVDPSGWARGVDPMFLGFRTRAGGDAALLPKLAGKVHVNTAGIAHTFDPRPTLWRAALAAVGDAWEYAPAQLVVRLTGFSNGGADVTICRKIGTAETQSSCLAGLDADCNGLVGAAEPAPALPAPMLRFHHYTSAGAPVDAPATQGQQRLVSALLRELDASRQAGAATAAELAAVEGELLSVLRRKQERRRSSSAEDNSGVAPRKVAASYRPAAPVPAQHGIPAFRPGGRAPPSKPRLSPKRTPQQAQPPLVPELAALQQDNQELRGHLEAVYAHCRQLQQEQRQLQQEQRQLQRHVKASGSGAAAPAAHAEPPHGHMASPRRHLASPPTHHYATSATCTAAAAAEKQRQRQRSPGRTTLVVAPPRAGGADLALAVFEAPPEDGSELRLALNRAQRQCLKLSSKLSKAQEEAAERRAEARRWQAETERQAEEIGELRVLAERERRRQRELEGALGTTAGELGGAREDAAALVGQLQLAEGAVATAEGEASALRGQLAAVQEQLERAAGECERLREEAVNTNARLSATDLVRREAERERDSLELQVQRLRAALAEERAQASTAAEEAAGQVATAREQAAVERQRAEMLQGQLQLAESQARETERVLTEQLCVVQEERNACLQAAARADALLVRLGQHALVTRGGD